MRRRWRRTIKWWPRRYRWARKHTGRWGALRHAVNIRPPDLSAQAEEARRRFKRSTADEIRMDRLADADRSGW